MKIHEYQAKEILRAAGVPVPKSIVARTPDEAAAAFTTLAGPIAVVKAQIHAGGRGKGTVKENPKQHGCQRLEMRDALFNAAKDKGQAQAVNPLILDGRKLIPSVTRVFSTQKEMYVFLQAYQPGEEPAEPLSAYVTFYQGAEKAFETSPLVAADALPNRLKTTQLQFSFPLEKLHPGEYLCQVTVVDAKHRKAAFWQAPVMLVP